MCSSRPRPFALLQQSQLFFGSRTSADIKVGDKWRKSAFPFWSTRKRYLGCFLYLTFGCKTFSITKTAFLRWWHRIMIALWEPLLLSSCCCDDAHFLKVPWEEAAVRPFTYLVPPKKRDPCQCKLHVRHPHCSKNLKKCLILTVPE